MPHFYEIWYYLYTVMTWCSALISHHLLVSSITPFVTPLWLLLRIFQLNCPMILVTTHRSSAVQSQQPSQQDRRFDNGLPPCAQQQTLLCLFATAGWEDHFKCGGLHFLKSGSTYVLVMPRKLFSYIQFHLVIIFAHEAQLSLNPTFRRRAVWKLVLCTIFCAVVDSYTVESVTCWSGVTNFNHLKSTTVS